MLFFKTSFRIASANFSLDLVVNHDNRTISYKRNATDVYNVIFFFIIRRSDVFSILV